MIPIELNEEVYKVFQNKHILAYPYDFSRLKSILRFKISLKLGLNQNCFSLKRQKDKIITMFSLAFKGLSKKD